MAIISLQQAEDIRQRCERESSLQASLRVDLPEDVSYLAVPCLVNLSTALHLSGDTKQGLQVLEAALDLDPRSGDVLNNLVVLLSHEATPHSVDHAETCIKRALSLHRKDPRYYNTYANFVLLVQQQPLAAALDVLFEGLEEVPDCESSSLLLHIGNLLASGDTLTQQNEALDYFERAVSADPQNGRAVAVLAAAVERRAEHESRPSSVRLLPDKEADEEGRRNRDMEQAIEYPETMGRSTVGMHVLREEEGGEEKEEEEEKEKEKEETRHSDKGKKVRFIPQQHSLSHLPSEGSSSSLATTTSSRVGAEQDPARMSAQRRTSSLNSFHFYDDATPPSSQSIPVSSSSSSSSSSVTNSFLIEGMLSKKSGKRGIWQERYVQLSEGRQALEWFSNKSCAQQGSQANNSLSLREVEGVSYEAGKAMARDDSAVPLSPPSASFYVLVESGR